MTFDNFVLLFCNGDPPSMKRLRSLIPKPSLVACADGGAEKAMACGYEPNLIVGDLDSFIKTKGVFNKTEIIKIPSQDNTDFEKALDILIERGFYDFIVTAFSGGRIDQELANLQVAYEYSKKCRIVLLDYSYLVFPTNKDFSLDLSSGTEVSMIPMEDDTRISTSGLQYALHNMLLRKGGQGISNETVVDRFTITVHKGGLLVFVRNVNENDHFTK